VTPTPTDAWQIGGVEVSRLEGSQPDMVRGESDAYDVALVPDGRGDHVARYESLMAYQPYVGEYDLYQSDDGTVYYHEQHGQPSLLTAVVPATDDPTGRGVWGLIDDIGDDTETPQMRCLVSVDVTYVADLRRYDTEAQASAAHEVDGGP